MSSVLTRIVLALALVLGVVACEKGEDSPAAVAQCEQLVSASCEQFFACRLVTSVVECEREILQEMGCENAVRVTDDYDACLTQTDGTGASCPALPIVCSGVILMR